MGQVEKRKFKHSGPAFVLAAAGVEWSRFFSKHNNRHSGPWHDRRSPARSRSDGGEMHMLLRATLFALALLLVPTGLQAQNTDDFVFIHHSCGSNWLGEGGLTTALDAKTYIDEVNDITYGTDMPSDTGRPDSLGSVPGDNTNMNHWVPWFNDYLAHVKTYGCSTGVNRIIMFKSCYPLSNITEDGSDPAGDPFSGTQSLANYRAVFRHPSGSGNTYSNGGYTYRPLEDIFAQNPDFLFVVVTAPSNVPSETCNDWADRARVFGNWLKNDWLGSYNAAHPTLKNVVVFDWFDFLTYANSYTGTEVFNPSGSEPYGTYRVRNMTKSGYRSSSSDSHPNTAANTATTQVFALDTGNFIDTAFANFDAAEVGDWQLY